MKIKIFYGMSGTLKGATMTSQKVDSVLNTWIKPWKTYQYGVFNGKLEENNLYYGILHLVCLKNFLENNKEKENLLVERGVTDSLFYYYMKEGDKVQDPEFIKSVIDEENKLLGEAEIERTLLIQKDEDFIKNVVLKNKIRKRTFEDCDLSGYLMLQDLYVDFTKEYNTIDKIVEITDAKDYIVNDLKLDWIKQ